MSLLLAALLLAQAAPLPAQQQAPVPAPQQAQQQADQQEVVPTLQEQAQAIAQQQEQIAHLQQNVSQLSTQVDQLDQQLQQQGQAREQLQANVQGLEDRGAALEEGRRARMHEVEGVTNQIVELERELERGNTNPADAIPPLRSAIQSLILDAQSRSGSTEVRPLQAALDTLEAAERALRSGDLYWGRVGIITAMDYALQARAAAGANPNRAWTN